MGRGKTKWDLIDDDSARRVRFDKRRKAVEKKAHELATLCDVKICMIMYGPSRGDFIVEPMIWPDDQDLINSMIKDYREKPQEIRDCRNSNIVKFYQEKSLKVEEEIKKFKKQNDESKYRKFDASYEDLSRDEIVRFGHLLEAKLTEVDSKIELLRGTDGGSFRSLIEGQKIEENLFMPNCGFDDFWVDIGGLTRPFSSPLEMSQTHQDALMALNCLEGQRIEESAIMPQRFQTYPGESMFFNSWEGPGMRETKVYQDESMAMNYLWNQDMQDSTFMVQSKIAYEGESMASNSLWNQEMQDNVFMLQSRLAYEGNKIFYPSLEEQKTQENPHFVPHMRVGHPHFDPNVMGSQSYSQTTTMDNALFNNGMFSLDQMPMVMHNNVLDGVNSTPSLHNYVPPTHHHPVPLCAPRSMLSDVANNQAMLRYENENI